jgi:hypothetical protein
VGVIGGWTPGGRVVGWSQTQSHVVRISAAIDSAGTVAHAYLSRALVAAGVSLAPADLVAQVTIHPSGAAVCAPIYNCVQTLDDFTTLFHDLPLGRGTYYLMISGAWSALSPVRPVVTASDISLLFFEHDLVNPMLGAALPFAVIEESQQFNSSIVSAKTSPLGGQPAGSGPFPDFYYHIVASHSREFLDVTLNSCADGAQIIQKPASGSDSQLWSFQPDEETGTVALVNKASGKALEISGLANGFKAEQSTRIPKSASQEFSVAPVGSDLYRIIVVGSGRVFDIEAKSLTDGARLQQWDWLGASDNGNQRFLLQAVSLVLPGVKQTCR